MQEHNKILMIEDNTACIKFYTTHLKASGFHVVTADNGMQGLSLARHEKPDLILLDIMLPQIDGLKICHLIKKDRELKDIPIAILTSRDTEEEADKARQCGADAFLLKTTHIDIVLDVVKKLLIKRYGGLADIK